MASVWVPIRFRFNEKVFDDRFLVESTSLLSDLKNIAMARLNKEDNLSNLDGEKISLFLDGKKIGRDLKDFNLTESEALIDVVLETPIMAIPTGRCAGSLTGHSEAVLDCEFSPCGNYLASGSGDGTVRLWDVLTKTPLKSLNLHKHWVQKVSWSPDSRFLLSGSMNGEVYVTRFENLEAGIEATSLPLKHTLKSAITSVAWSKEKQGIFALGTSAGELRICDAALRLILVTPSGHEKAITSLLYLATGQLVSTSRDCWLKVWSLEGTLVGKHKKHAHWINCCDLGKDHLYTGSDDNTIVMYQLSNLDSAKKLVGHQAPVNYLLVSPNKARLASASFDKSIKIWDATSGEFLKSLRGHTAPVYRISWSRDSRYLASISKDSTVKVWDVGSGKMIRQLSEHRDEVYCIDWSSQGVLASGSKDRTLKLWD